MSHNVFISYSTKDSDVANKACAYLEEHGVHCWMAQRDVRAGQDWTEAIVNAILESKLVLLIFSSNSNNSTQVNREIHIAADEGIPILPFQIEDIRPSTKLRYYLSTPHWLDAFSSSNGSHFALLLNSVKTFIPTETYATSSSEISPAAESNASRPTTTPLAPLEHQMNWLQRLLRFFLLLFSFEKLTFPPNSNEQTIQKKKKIFRNTGIISVLWWILLVAVDLSWNGVGSDPMPWPVKLLFTAVVTIIICLPPMIAAWLMAYFARTHLIYGFICGMLGPCILFTLGLFAKFVGLDESKKFLLGIGLACVVAGIQVLGTFRKFPLLWIWSGLYSLFFIISGSINLINYVWYHSLLDDAYFLPFGFVGLGLNIWVIIQSRRQYGFNKRLGH